MNRSILTSLTSRALNKFIPRVDFSKSLRNMQNQTLYRYFTKRHKSEVEEEGDLHDQPASSRSRMEEVREEPIADSGTCGSTSLNNT